MVVSRAVVSWAVACVILATLSAVDSVGCTRADETEVARSSGAHPREIASKYIDATVLLVGMQGDKKILGTGFLVRSSGVIVTNRHVVDDVYPIAVKMSDGDVYTKVELVADDERRDIAVLKIQGFGLPTVPLGDSGVVGVGDEVVVIGNPLGLDRTVSTGIVSAIRDSGDGYKYIQITAPISPGSSGSPVFGSNGTVIGVATAGMRSGQNLNFALPINYVRPLISETSRRSLAALSRGDPSLDRFETRVAKSTEVGLNTDEWCLRLVPILEKLGRGIDRSVVGQAQTLAGMTRDAVIISSDLYLAHGYFRDALESAASIEPSDQRAMDVHRALRASLGKSYRALTRQLDLWRSVAKDGYEPVAAELGLTRAELEAAAEQLTDIAGSSIQKHVTNLCPHVLEKFPYWFSHELSEEELPPVYAGIVPCFSSQRVCVLMTAEGSPAGRAGLLPGDIVIGVKKDARFRNWDDWFEYMRNVQLGKGWKRRIGLRAIRLEVLRGGRVIVRRLMIRERPPGFLTP